MSRKVLIDWTDDQHIDTDWIDIIETIREQFSLSEHLVAIKIKSYIGYDVSVHYDLIDNDYLYEWLDHLVTCSDCKNGIQLYQDDETGEKYLCITGQNYYDRITDEYEGTNKVHLYFKEYVW